jgi:hypothetical protein
MFQTALLSLNDHTSRAFISKPYELADVYQTLFHLDIMRSSLAFFMILLPIGYKEESISSKRIYKLNNDLS